MTICIIFMIVFFLTICYVFFDTWEKVNAIYKHLKIAAEDDDEEANHDHQ